MWGVAIQSCLLHKGVSSLPDQRWGASILGVETTRVSPRAGSERYTKPCKPLCPGALDEDVVVIESTPAPAPPVPASEEINVTSTDSEVEIVTVGDGFRWATDGFSHPLRATSLHFDWVEKEAVSSLPSSHHHCSRFCIMHLT